MGGANATRSVEEGADTAVWLATEAPKAMSGKFFRDRKVIDLGNRFTGLREKEE
jgi:hypothetical protein